MKKLAMCVTCGSEVKPKTRVKGSVVTEFVLWIFFLLPGVIYSIWRLSTKEKVCTACGASTLVPIDSPVALHLRASLNLPVAPPSSATTSLPAPSATLLPPMASGPGTEAARSNTHW